MEKIKKQKVAVAGGALVVAALAAITFLILTGDDDALTSTGQSSTVAISLEQKDNTVQSDATLQEKNGIDDNTSLDQTATSLKPDANKEEDTSSTDASQSLSAKENLEMILASPTRNTSFDNNKYKDVPMADIDVSGLTENADLYDEGLLDTTNSGFFRVKCEVSHFAYDDPIVFPGEPGNGHLHMFFGNTKANAYSTFDSLMNTGTGTCNGEDLNRTAYWIPAVLDENGYALLPDHIMVYYKNDNAFLNGANELVEPFPDDLRIIAGEGRATSPQTERTGENDIPHVSFSCGPAYGDNQKQPLIPQCSAPNFIEAQIAFPSCWDGKNLYEEDQSHMAQPLYGYFGSTCPDTHPNDISSIMYRVFFKPADYGGTLKNLYLSSDVRNGELLPGGTTLHGDWFGAWHPEAMRQWVTNCNNKRADCEIGILNRNPMVSMVPRKTGHYPRGTRIAPEELAKLCPGESFDASNPVVSLSHCGRGSTNS